MAKNKRQWKKTKGIITAVSAAMLVLFSAFIGYMDRSAQKKQEETPVAVFPDYQKISVECPKIKEMLLTKNRNSRPGIPLKKVNGIVVHYTANPNTDAKANRNYFESRKDLEDVKANKVSSHYIIGLSGNIIRCIPDEEIAYASNDRNEDTLSIECCHPDDSGKFSSKTYHSLVHLVAYLADRYEIDLDQIIRHYDVSGKECPKYYVRHESAWERFHEDVRNYLKKSMKGSREV